MRHDVIVLGLGGAGSAAACMLARRGLRVLGLDAAGPANDVGSSHGGSRIVRMAYAEGAQFVPLLQRAHALWEELGAAAGETLLRRTGILLIGAREGFVVNDTLACARAAGLPHDLLDAGGIRQRSPATHVADDWHGVFDPLAGLVSPEQAVRAQHRLAEAAGATLRFHTKVRDWSSTSSGVTVHTDTERFDASHLVICAGAWAPRLLGSQGLRLTVQRQVQHWFDVPASQAAAFRPDVFPIHVWEGEHLFYCMPMIDGPGGGLKCCLELDPPAIDPDDLDREIAAGEIARVQAVLAAHVPAASGRWLRGAVCMYAASADNRFMIGALPDASRVVLASGLGGHGFKFTPAIGELVADIVTGEGEDLASRLAPFDPRRLLGAL